MFKKVTLYYNTLKYVKPIQIINRIVRRFTRINAKETPAKFICPLSEWEKANYNQQSFFEENVFVFLNHAVKSPQWNDEKQSKLWLYNLHYFDDLNAHNNNVRKETHRKLIKRWIDENPPLKGNGWEPYPLSLRIVNWIKWRLEEHSFSDKILKSLALQTHVLSQSIEYHLLGNHLFANGKALYFAGLCLDSEQSKVWRKKGEKILLRELEEQFLSDGAHFELSPMYHSILLVDCLDLFNLATTYSDKFSPILKEKLGEIIPKALVWLQAMSHTDGEISFFNDATLGIAWNNKDIFNYAKSLGFEVVQREEKGLLLEDSGYVSIKNNNYSFIADLAEIGPSYIPGHAHADTFSFEWSLKGQRIFVNSGISEYGISEKRLQQRQTSSHNTVVVNNLSSSEVWSGFRVARRASVINYTYTLSNGIYSFSAVHNGYKKQGINCLHERQFVVEDKKIEITDKINGKFEKAFAYLILHPYVKIIEKNENKVFLKVNKDIVCVEVFNADILVEDCRYYPGFGLIENTKKIRLDFFKQHIYYKITW